MRHSFVRDRQNSSSPRVEHGRKLPRLPGPTIAASEHDHHQFDSRTASSKAVSEGRAFDWSNVPAGPKADQKRSRLVEPDAKIQAARLQPHVFIPKHSLPAVFSTKKHLSKFLRGHNAPGYDTPQEIHMGSFGWYLIFSDSSRGSASVVRCVEEMDGQRLFTEYVLVLQPFPYGLQDTMRTPNKATESGEKLRPGSPVYMRPFISTAISEPTSPRPSPARALPVTAPNGAPLSRSQSRRDTQEPADTNVMRPSKPSDFDEGASTISSTARSDFSRSKQAKCHVCRKPSVAGVPALTQCSTCPRRYHRHCHMSPSIDPSLVETNIWRCSRCVSKNTIEPEKVPEEATLRISASSPLSNSPAMSPRPPAKKARLDNDERTQGTPTPNLERRQMKAPDSQRPSGQGKQRLSESATDAAAPKQANDGHVESSRPTLIDDADALIDKSFAADSTSLREIGKTKSGKLKFTRTKKQRAGGSTLQPNDLALDSDVSDAHAARDHPAGLAQDDPSEHRTTTEQERVFSIEHGQPDASPQASSRPVDQPTAADLRAVAVQRQAKIQEELINQGKVVPKGVEKASSSNVAPSQPRTEAASKALVDGPAGEAGLPTTLEDAMDNREPREELNQGEASPQGFTGVNGTSKFIEDASAKTVLEQPLESRNDVRSSDLESSMDSPSEHSSAPPLQHTVRKSDQALSASPNNNSAAPLAHSAMSSKAKKSGTKFIPCVECHKNKILRDPQGINRLCLRCKQSSAREKEALDLDHPARKPPRGSAEKATRPSSAVSQVAPAQIANAKDENGRHLRENAVPAASAESASKQDGSAADLSVASKQDDSTPKATLSKVPGSTRRSCDKCYTSHQRCTHNTVPSSSRRRSCDECYTSHQKCTHYSAPSSNGDWPDSIETNAQKPKTFSLHKPAAKTPRHEPDTTLHAEGESAGPAAEGHDHQPTNEKLARVKAEVGDSFGRPVGAAHKLVGMAFMSVPNQAMQARNIFDWIAENIPGFSIGQGNWESIITAHLSAKRCTSEKPGYWTATKWQEGDGGKGRGYRYKLMPGVADTLWQWDEVLKEPSSPQRPVPTPYVKDTSGLVKDKLLVKLKAAVPKDRQSGGLVEEATSSQQTVQKSAGNTEAPSAASLHDTGTDLEAEMQHAPLDTATPVGDKMDIDVPGDKSVDDEAPARVREPARPQATRNSEVLDLGHDSSEDESLVRRRTRAPTRSSKAPVAVMQSTPSVTDGNEQSDSGVLGQGNPAEEPRPNHSTTRSRSPSRRPRSRSSSSGSYIALEYHPKLGAAENEGRWFACSEERYDNASKEVKSRFYHAARMLFTEEGAAPGKACTACKDPAECLAYSAAMRETRYNLPKKCAHCMVLGRLCDVDVEPKTATESAPAPAPAPGPKEHKKKPSLQVVAVRETTKPSLAELIRQANKTRPWTDKPFFDEYPEYRQENFISKEDRVAEIGKRPTRKQLFGKPAAYSRLKAAKPIESETSYLPPAMRGTVSPEKRQRAIVDALPTDAYGWEEPGHGISPKECMSLEEFFGLPSNPIPIVSEGQLAFRDGTRTDDGRLPRARVVYKVGYGAKV